MDGAGAVCPSLTIYLRIAELHGFQLVQSMGFEMVKAKGLRSMPYDCELSALLNN
jgi:hypothetical protein